MDIAFKATPPRKPNHNKSFQGFALAEVLITLSIIGIIAVITVSSITQYFQKQQMITGVKTAYSMLSELIRMSEAENGPIEQWDIYLNKTDFFNTYFRPYLNIVKDCGTGITTNKDNQCFYSPDGAWYDIVGEEQKTGGGVVTADYYYKVVLKNGMSLGVNRESSNPNGRIYIIVDINGKKGKSITGKDIFFFTVIPNSKIQPASGRYYEQVGVLLTGLTYRYLNTNTSATYKNSNGLLNNVAGGCNKNTGSSQFNIAGGLCARVLELNGWKIPKNYPW